ncbi:MAG: hypothetical protein CM15mV47_410 [uncultured marine virus]|nr:MAG: hypothetical protein CM15mV47_410 [uncultured marine virus]
MAQPPVDNMIGDRFAIAPPILSLRTTRDGLGETKQVRRPGRSLEDTLKRALKPKTNKNCLNF